MPTITDATVVAQAYDTSGNGGRKLVRLDNGWLVAALAESTSILGFYVSKDNGVTWNRQTSQAINTSGGYSVFGIGTDVYYIVANGSSVTIVNKINMITNTYTNISPNSGFLDNGQTATQQPTMTTNEAKTELHATWASKNSTYSSSFNIRYAKGTINADGTVTWGAVEQVTNANTSGYNVKNPSIILDKNGNAHIITDYLAGNYAIVDYSKSFSSQEVPLSVWNSKYILPSSSYAQSSPSAIFVPQSINGLANGRIWVAWHGTDATDTTSTNIRVSYSDDLGVTWSAMQKLTSGNAYNQLNTSITANKANEIFILFNGAEASYTSYNIKQIKNSGGTWGSVTRITNNTGDNARYPSCLFDLSVNYSSPLFIYQNMQTAKVGFYGTWTVTSISVAPGDIGQKADKNNILSYSITTDGEMSTITEKINGTVVNTRNTTSGQAVTLGLTQAQWDAIRFGKYADATGGKNTLTVEMGSEKWTYTFDKQLASDSDIISASKAVKDANEVYLPSVKKQLADAINAKGGSVSANADWLTMIDGLNGVSSGRKASGTITSASSSTTTILASGGSAPSVYYVSFDMSVLGFIPSRITFVQSDRLSNTVITWSKDDIYYTSSSDYGNAMLATSAYRCPFVNGIVKITVPNPSRAYDWRAYE